MQCASLIRLRCVVLPFVLATASIVSAAESPNFIVILTDDQGWGTTSSIYDPNHPQSKSDFFRTPSIEYLAGAGMRFTQAYAPHPNCSPTRASIQTGRSPAALHFTDICGRDTGPLYVGNRLIPPQHISDLPKKDKTIPELLKAHNPAYRAGHFGKWHQRGGGPSQHGYDASDGATGNREGSLKTNLPEDPKQAFGMTGRAARWMQKQVVADAPFYLQVSHYATHLKYQSRPKTRQRFESASKGTRHNNVPFAAMINDMDTAIGTLIELVDELGIRDNTYIIYTADNGTYPTKDPANINGPLHGHKATIWEGGVRVPFIVVGPGVKAGSISRVPAIGWDILPTVCDLAGVKKWPAAVEGGSLKAIIHGDGTGKVNRPREGLYFHWPHYQHQKRSKPDSTIVLDGWKLHYWWETGEVSLFHLAEDLAESRDLAEQQPERAKAMKDKLMAYLSSIKAQLPKPNPTFDPANDPAIRKKR
jgi:arylsulfatase A-like enzyme